MTKYAIAHAPKGASFVIYDNEDGKLISLRLKDSPADPPKMKKKTSFLETLKSGDVVVVEMGGAADKLALAAVAYGAEVQRYPSFLLSVEKIARFAGVEFVKGKKDDDGTSIDEIGEPLCKRLGIKWKAEKAAEKETADELGLRKLRALTMWSLWSEQVPGFYKLTPSDVDLLRLKFAIRSYMRSYKATMRSYQGILSAYRDQVFIDLAFGRQLKADALEEEIYSRLLENLCKDILGGEISDIERQDFYAQIGKTFKDEGGKLPARASEEMIAKLVESFMESDDFKSTVFSRLKSQKRRIEKMLDGGMIRETKESFQPNDLYRAVFEPITGCGPMIAAKFIVGISDIRRFETFANFKAYCGLHHFSDGTRARRRKGHVSNWKTELKQAAFDLTEQIVRVKKAKKADDMWCRKLDARKAFELVKLLRDRQAKADEQGLDVVLLPEAYRRSITSVMDMQASDFTVLAAHILELQERAGVAFKGNDEEEAETLESEEDEEVEETAKTPEMKLLGKLVKGLKGKAHQKGLRWLKQQMLKHIFTEWRKAVGVYDIPRPRQSENKELAPVTKAEYPAYAEANAAE